METPESQAIHEAVKRYTDIHGDEGAVLGKIVESIAAAIAMHEKQIRESADNPENQGKSVFGVRCVWDRNKRKGEITLAFTPRRVRETVEFELEDPNQGKLPLNDERPRVVAAYPSPDDADQRV